MTASIFSPAAPAAVELRPYQGAVIDRIAHAFHAGHRRLLMVAPTGSGKTVIGARIILNVAGDGKRVLVLAHRREIIGQTSSKLYAAGVDHGIIQAGFGTRPGVPVQVASISTLHARAVRSSRMDLPDADLVVVDEAHHCPARSYRAILESYPDAHVLGMTATPCRGDGRGLGDFFDEIVECPPVAELIAAGFLVPTKVYAPTRPDLAGVHVARGDYVESELAERMDQAKLVGDVVTHWLRLAERRRTVLFATGVAHSVHLRDEFRRAGIWAEHIDGSTPVEQRDEILKKLDAGTVEVVTNAAVLVEGWDCPSVSCLVLARPTRHMGLFRQMVGRVLRPAPGKTDALILDHAAAVFEHGFVEEPVIWTLSPDGRAENPKHRARGQYQAPSLTTCPECTAVRFEGRPCAACGWQPRPKAASVAVAEGELGHVDRARNVRAQAYTSEQKASFFGQLLYIARERGYQKGWAAHKYREKFGVWPRDRYAVPIIPDPEVRSWVRSRQIAFARSHAKQESAA